VDLPFGQKLRYDGRGLEMEPPNPPPDGVYGDVVVDGGTISEVRPASLPVYTPAPCAPLPEPCGDQGDGWPGLDPSYANLTRLDPAGRVVTKIYVDPGKNISATGVGSAEDPLRISSSVDAPRIKFLSLTPDVLPLTGGGSEENPGQLAHAASPLAAGPHGSLTTDAYGHVTAYDLDSSASGMTLVDVVPMTLTKDENNGAVILGLPVHFNSEVEFDTDTSRVTVDIFGRVIAVAPADNASFGRHVKFFQGLRTDFSFAFATGYRGRVRASYRGDLGLNVSGSGLAAMPSSVSVFLDGDAQDAYAVLDGGRVVGFEFYAPEYSAPGPHTVSVTSAVSVSSPGFLDVSLCR
jgi:hypothetical protein